MVRKPLGTDREVGDRTTGNLGEEEPLLSSCTLVHVFKNLERFSSAKTSPMTTWRMAGHVASCGIHVWNSAENLEQKIRLTTAGNNGSSNNKVTTVLPRSRR